jgi:hypothetical protein
MNMQIPRGLVSVARLFCTRGSSYQKISTIYLHCEMDSQAPGSSALLAEKHPVTDGLAVGNIKRHESGSVDDKPPELQPPSARKQAAWLNIPRVLPSSLQWIPNNWALSKIKPVVRCSISAWVASVLFVIPSVEIWLGQV